MIKQIKFCMRRMRRVNNDDYLIMVEFIRYVACNTAEHYIPHDLKCHAFEIMQRRSKGEITTFYDMVFISREFLNRYDECNCRVHAPNLLKDLQEAGQNY